MNFDTLSAVDMVNFPFQPKAIQDEMGEAFEKEYGRMSGNLGLEVPLTQAGVAQNLILYPYVNPASELINASLLPSTMIIDPTTGLPDSTYKVEPLSNPGDGTQIWKITHNGVDTHPIHFHLFDVQVINRVGWDGIIRPPEANELGWKDTVRISPLEDTIVALRPIIPVVPFALPNSVRTLNPMMPEGSIVMFANVDAEGNPTDPIINTPVNFGWEYVWHCHILSHEEMDMMRPMSVGVPPSKPEGLSVAISGRNVTLNWTDTSQTETGFIVQYAEAAAGPWMDQATLPANAATYTYRKGRNAPSYFYRILASNTIGYNATPGYSTMNVTAASAIVNDTGTVVTPDAPSAPSNLTAAVQAGPAVQLTWTDNSTTETAFIIERALGGGAFEQVGRVDVTNPLAVGGQIFYTDNTVAVGNNYSYRVAATAGGQPSYSNTVSVSTALVPAAPAMANATASLSRNGRNATVTVTWGDVANETGYNIQIATDASFAAVVSNNSVGVDVTSYTSGKLATGTPYFVRVRAFNGSGTSAWTNAAPFPVTTP
ncbi:MAG: multicopper oxidase domain-containing protein, partial [Gammaproteobacteria bacterium]|nr:multicopper oxidase domain-containing protein [Gammaproteobacteria bacterium]